MMRSHSGNIPGDFRSIRVDYSEVELIQMLHDEVATLIKDGNEFENQYRTITRYYEYLARSLR